ncbi:MAG: hypothetical protein HY431_02580 [Candidatus Levybacteria bacterium]|nr:hypothetical protein [Candidatus Levybacteria bacterium]
MVDGSPRHPISPQDAGFQAPTSGDLSLPQHDLVLPDTVPQTAKDIWGPNAIRIHRVEGDGENARGFLTVTPELVAWTRSLPAITGFRRADGETGIGTLTPRAHFTGHFGGLLSQYKLLPGHYSERAGAMTAGLTAANTSLADFTGEVVVIDIAGVDFSGVVQPGGTGVFMAELLGQEGSDYYANIRGSNREKEIINMRGVHFRIKPTDESILPTDEIDEAAVQAVAAIGLGIDGLELDDQGVPISVGLFKRIAGSKYYRAVKAGDELQTIPKGLMKRISGDRGILMAGAKVINQCGELVASYDKMTAGIISYKDASKRFQGQAA